MARTAAARLATVLLAVALAACGGSAAGSHETPAPSTVSPATVPATTGSEAATSTAPATDPTIDRPFEVFAPDSYDGSAAMPLVVLLHGYGITGEMQEEFFQLQPLAESRGFLLAHPDGTIDADGSHFWNATDACCGFGATVDDSAYLAAVIRHIEADYRVDPARVFLVGFSNGGFMSYRMACDHADLIAAIVSISGATFLDPAACNPSEPVTVAEIHGDNDEAIAYEGGTFRDEPHPGAQQTVAEWAGYNGCTGPATEATEGRDLDRRFDDAIVTQYEGCPPSGAVELWTIPHGTHIPELSSTFSAQVIDFLLAHPKQ